MFEGKHIHFSPLDNKPLCSYSSKLCRQRRLNGYAFCIRHILEDKSAPFKQCSFVTRNNYQKCLNAIPSNQERGYCHSHMQVAGIIPKTERKSKVSMTTTTTTNTSSVSTVGSNGNSSNGSTNGSSITNAPNVVTKGSSAPPTDGSLVDPKKTEEIPPPADSKILNGSNSKASPSTANNLHNNSNNNNNQHHNVKNNSSKGKSYLAAPSLSSSSAAVDKVKIQVMRGKDNKANGSLTNPGALGDGGGNSTKKLSTPGIPTPSAVKKEPRAKTVKQQQAISGPTENVNGKGKRKSQQGGKNAGGADPTLSCNNINNNSGSSSNNNNSSSSSSCSSNNKITSGSTNHDTSNIGDNPVYTLCVRDRWKNFKFLPELEDNKPATKLERMRTVRLLEKLPLFVEAAPPKTQSSKSSSKSDVTKKPKDANFGNIPMPSAYDLLLVPPFLTKSRLLHRKNSCDNQFSNDDLIELDKTKLAEGTLTDGNCETVARQQWEWETRKEFLTRVRQAFKHQYRTIRKAFKLNDRVDKNEKAFRSALLSCALSDASLCAKILTSDDSSKVNQVPNSSGSSEDARHEFKGNFPTCNGKLPKSFLGSQLVNGKLTARALKANGMRDDPLLHNGRCNSNSDLDGYDGSNDVKTTHVKNDIIMSSTKQSHSSSRSNINGTACENMSWGNGMNGNVSELKKGKGTTKSVKSNRSVNGTLHAQARPRDTGMLKKGNAVPGEGSSTRKKSKKSTSPASTNNVKPSLKKRKIDSGVISNEMMGGDLKFKAHGVGGSLSKSMELDDPTDPHHDLLHDSLSSDEKLLGVPSVVDLNGVSGLETVLNSVSSSDPATTPEGVITDASFDSPFDHSTSSHPDCEFSDDDLEKSFELQIDPEIAHQASRLLEDNGLTEDDFNDLFPETRMGDHKMIGRADIGDLGIDFTSNFDASDIDYSLFANIFPNFRSNQPESISVNQQF